MSAFVAGCTIVKDEIRAIVEWVAYYKAIGVDQILVYDNGSTDGTFEVLKSLEAQAELTVTRWFGEKPQETAYQDALVRSEAEWICYFDCDEFLVPMQHQSLRDYLSEAPADVGAIAVNWLVFGDNDEQNYRPLPVIERFLKGTRRTAGINYQIKTIGRRRTMETMSIHDGVLRDGRYVTSSFEDMELKGAGRIGSVDHRLLVLNHYFVKSREEWEIKKSRGSAVRPARSRRKSARLQNVLERTDANSRTYSHILRFAPAMRREAERLRILLERDGLDFPVWPFTEEPRSEA